MKKIFTLIFAVLATLTIANAQQLQTQLDPLFYTNSAYTNGVAPGYAPTNGGGLVLNISSGTTFCNTTISETSATTITLTDNSTNYVYLNFASNCAVTANTTSFATTRQFPIAVVITSNGKITNIDDVRSFFTSGTGGGGTIVAPGATTDVPYNCSGILCANGNFTTDGNGNATFSGTIAAPSSVLAAVDVSGNVVPVPITTLSGDALTCAGGPLTASISGIFPSSYAAGLTVFISGATNSGNNGTFVLATGSTSLLTFANSSCVAETLPSGSTLSGGGIVDNAPAIQAGINSAYTKQIRDVYIGEGNIGMCSTLFVPYGITVHGKLSTVNNGIVATRLIPMTSGQCSLAGSSQHFTQNTASSTSFMLCYDSPDCVHWVVSPNATVEGGGGVRDVNFLNLNSVSAIAGIFVWGENLWFDNIGSSSMPLLQRGPTPVSPSSPQEYADGLRITRAEGAGTLSGGSYFISIYGSGDALDIENSQFPTNSNAILIQGRGAGYFGQGGSVSGGKIDDIIGGSLLIGGNAIDVSNSHFEQATITYQDGSSGTLISDAIYEHTGNNIPPVEIQSGSQGTSVTAVGVSWKLPGVGTPFDSSTPGDVAVASGATFSCRDCIRIVGGAAGNGTSYTGIKLTQIDGATPINAWNGYADYLSRSGTIGPSYNVTPPGVVSYWFNAYAGLTNITAVSGTWTIAPGTYYYNSIRLLDQPSITGVIQSNGEASTTVDSSHVVQFTDSMAGTSSTGMVRIYRGTASNTYGYYADVPFISPASPYPIDDGTSIAGVSWIARTAGPMSTPVNATAGYYALYGAGIVAQANPNMTATGATTVFAGPVSTGNLQDNGTLNVNGSTSLHTLGLIAMCTATSGANCSSSIGSLYDSIWNGSAPVTYGWATQDVVGSGTYGSSVYTLSYSGVSGIPQWINFTEAFVSKMTLTTYQSVIASASTIAPTAQSFHVSGTTTIATITAPAACTQTGNTAMCTLTIIPDGVWATTTSGNIANVVTAVVNVPISAVYDPTATKWYMK